MKGYTYLNKERLI